MQKNKKQNCYKRFRTNCCLTFQLFSFLISKIFPRYPAAQETDVHYNSEGDAKFNWRMVYPNIKMPVKSATLEIAFLDFSNFGSTQLGEFNLDIKKFLDKVSVKKNSKMPRKKSAKN